MATRLTWNDCQMSSPRNHPLSGGATYQSRYKRITFLDPRVVRIESSPDGVFEDRPSLCVSNRIPVQVEHSVITQDSTTTLQSEHFSIQFNDDNPLFDATSLKVIFHSLAGSPAWSPGTVDNQNLGGTLRTLDILDGDTFAPNAPAILAEQQKVPPGLLSRSGWSVHDDSASVAIDDQKGGWAAPRHAGNQDYYLFSFGTDFKSWIGIAQKIFGHQPLPPRYAFGYWWSRYWAYTDKELEQIADECDQQGIPLDVIVLDMDWHQQGWTGLSWDRAYFPDPAEFFSKMKERGIHCSMNLHPADGIAPHEDCYAEAAHTLGMNIEEGKTIEFDCTDPKSMQIYFDVLKSHEEKGVEFWWLDWQQGTKSKMEGLDPLPWLNHLHYQHLENKYPERRPLNFSRYGGLGSGRYPIGFSGDSFVSWRSLKYQSYMTATAANVLYGYWSHDIGGHFHGHLDPELFTRWLQSGAYSPVLRTHATKQTTNDRQFWETGLPHSRVMKKVVNRRYELVPYIYTECRKCYDTGISLCRPTYYEYPEQEASYNNPQQYFFGSSIITAPINQQLDPLYQQATQQTYLPPGEWYSVTHGLTIKGDQEINDRYLLDETPLFVRSGTVLPGQIAAKRLTAPCYKDLLLEIYPGDSGEYELYEDDGTSSKYTSGESSSTLFSFERKESGIILSINRCKGTYPGFSPERTLTVRCIGYTPAAEIYVNGELLPYSRSNGNGWRYDGDSQTVQLHLSRIDLTETTTIKIGFKTEICFAPSGMIGALRRIHSAFDTVRILELPYERAVAALAQTGSRVSRNPDSYGEEIGQVQNSLRLLLSQEAEVRETLHKKSRYTLKKLGALDQTRALLQDALSLLTRE